MQKRLGRRLPGEMKRQGFTPARESIFSREKPLRQTINMSCASWEREETAPCVAAAKGKHSISLRDIIFDHRRLSRVFIPSRPVDAPVFDVNRWQLPLGEMWNHDASFQQISLHTHERFILGILGTGLSIASWNGKRHGASPQGISRHTCVMPRQAPFRQRLASAMSDLHASTHQYRTLRVPREAAFWSL